MDIPALLYDNPVLTVLLVAAIRAVFAWQRGLSYREVVLAEWIKARACARLDRVASRYGRSLVTEASPGDHVATLDMTPRELASEIQTTFDPNLTSTAKYRVVGDSTEWAHSQWATYYERDGTPWQTHLYLYARDDGRVAVYAHAEPSPEVPEKHTRGGKQRDGDAHGKLADALAKVD